MMNPVDRYAFLLSGLVCSEESGRAIVKRVRRMELEEEAIAFFQKAKNYPTIGRFHLYSMDQQRAAILGLQDYLKRIGMKVPVPNKLVQRFLDGGKYPVKKK